jgi:hypothetical protein
MGDAAYTVREADGMRAYRCEACGRKLTYLVENVEPGLVATFDRVARDLMRLHCGRECRGAATPGSGERGHARASGDRREHAD